MNLIRRSVPLVALALAIGGCKAKQSAQASQPAAIIFGPATPKHLRLGTRSRSAAISAAPN